MTRLNMLKTTSSAFKRLKCLELKRLKKRKNNSILRVSFKKKKQAIFFWGNMQTFVVQFLY
jgi:hypothetical protein